MSMTKKEKRNIEVSGMEKEIKEIVSLLYKTDLITERPFNEIKLLHEKNLRSVQCTGTPENIKEIDELVSSWDFKRVLCKKHHFKNMEEYRVSYEDIWCPPDSSDFYVHQYIQNGDYIREEYISIQSLEKVLIIDINRNFV